MAGTQVVRWVRTRLFGREYELRSAKKVLARLRWEKRDGSQATAEYGEQTWVFLGSRFILDRIVIRAADLKFVASFEATRTSPGALEFLDGRVFHWVPANFWHTEWGFTDPKGEFVARFQLEDGLIWTSGWVEVPRLARSPDDLPLFLVFGWHLLLLQAGKSYI